MNNMETDSLQLQRLTLRFASIVRQTLNDMIGGNYHFSEDDLLLEPFSNAQGLIAVIHFGGTVQGDCILVFRQRDRRKFCEAFSLKNGICIGDTATMLDAGEIISEIINTSTGQLLPFLEREIDAISIMPPMIVSGTLTFPKVASASIRINGPTGPITCIFALNLMRQKIAETLRSVSDDLEEKTRMALNDSLTSLYNRAFFDAKYRRIVESSHHGSRALSIMIIDIDCLKFINDTYGHQIGDEIIRNASHVIKNELRHDDIPCRYGGDEFIVMLPGALDVDVERIADRIRSRFADVPAPEKIDRAQHTTLSIGIGQLNRNETPEELFRRADLALYTAKNNGRDRIVIAPPKNN